MSISKQKLFGQLNAVSKLAKAIAVISAFGLTACGGTGQDDGSASGFNQEIAGRAIDGYIARATVYLDTNNDGRRNAWEPFAFTDDQGYFSYNPVTDTNYCASNATAEQAQYCLNTNVHYKDVVIRIDSGYDVTTGEPFFGQLSRRLSNDAQSNVENVLVTPLTSVLTDVSTDNQDSVLDSLGINRSQLDIDYLNTDGAGTVNSSLFKTATKIHKVVSVLSDRLADTYDKIGSEIGMPNDATPMVYREIASQMASTQNPLSSIIENQSSLISVMDSAEERIRKIYEKKDLELKPDIGDSNRPQGFSRPIQVASNIAEIVDRVIDNTAINSFSQVQGQSRTIESVVIKALKERDEEDDKNGENPIDPTLDSAINFFSNSSNSNLIDALLESMGSDLSDVDSLSRQDFSGEDFDSEDEIKSKTQLPAGAEAFTQVGGMQIKISEKLVPEKDRNQEDLKDTEVELYFNGLITDLSGSFSACIKHIDGASSIDGSLGDGNTKGELIEGFWSLLGATTSDPSSYSLLLTLTFLETTYQAIMKPGGIDPNTDKELFRFDYDGDIDKWPSDLGFVEIQTIPTTNQECEERLPSRVGL